MKVRRPKPYKVKASSTNTRKEKRKAERKFKKARKLAFAQRDYDLVKKMKNYDSYVEIQNEEKRVKKAEDNKRKKQSAKKRKAQAAQEKLEEMQKQASEEEKEHEEETLNEDDIEIKKWEKKLKLNKRKVKTKLPQSFVDEGWDYILDATESDKVKDFDDYGALMEEDSESSEEEEELDDETESDTELKSSWDPDSQVGKSILKKKKTKKEKKSVKFSLSQDDDDGGKDDNDDDESDKSDDFFAGGVDEDEDLDLGGCDDDDDDDDDDDQMDFEDFGDSDDDSNKEEEDEPLDEGDEGKVDEVPSDEKKLEEDGVGELKEDIYGRLRDKKGNVVSSAYVPPAKRAMMAGGQPNEALHKSLKGLVNKISEATMQFMTNKVESIYLENSRAAVNETLCGLIMEAVVMPALAPERLVAEIAMLLAILHGNVGSEVGAFFLQKLTVKFQALFDVPEYGSGKNADNILMLLSNLYNFQIVSSAFISDIIFKLIDRFNVRDIELLLLLFKTVGFTLRKDDPAQLKIIILDIQTKARQAEVVASEEGSENRVKFMLEILTAIRNNNMRMIPGYDPSHLAHLKKIAKSFLRGQVLGDNKLTIGLQDLLKADSSGKWWIVGSAWDGRNSKGAGQRDAASKTEATVELTGMNKKLLKLAKKQGMNTDVRKHIFCVIGTSEDFEDAFSRLICLGLNKPQERDIIHVIFHCCVNENSYNPFYAFLMEKFCNFDRRFMITVLHTMWDKFKEVNSMAKECRTKLGHLLTHLLLCKALSLSVLKAVEFGMESKKMIRLLVQVLCAILSTHNIATLTDIFQKIAPNPNLKALRTGLQVFMRVHLNGVAGKGLSSAELQDRVDKAESAMFSAQSTLM